MESVEICGGVGAFVSIIHSSHTCVRASRAVSRCCMRRENTCRTWRTVPARGRESSGAPCAPQRGASRAPRRPHGPPPPPRTRARRSIYNSDGISLKANVNVNRNLQFTLRVLMKRDVNRNRNRSARRRRRFFWSLFGLFFDIWVLAQI